MQMKRNDLPNMFFSISYVHVMQNFKTQVTIMGMRTYVVTEQHILGI